ncbi:DUF998 domain-containing protein [Chitinophagaceae bacterium LB-8]|uniref:DUF998 domain-containing protein n=1 Tax=Paraflavisolibacter caeni TaxID=2982496 RepID=A0A9X2XYW0_9BACT|nr:DUF998 domain-containing protein [Paraflavisolibacter caeni]MCU7551382.1 DUF998 domain-containing protein [Paraflavisolibacter caeni]
MRAPLFMPAHEVLPQEKLFRQSKWQRIILLFVLGYEGAGALVGGSLLVAAPDGSLMDMPVAIMHGSFSDFLIPGILLFALGILNTAAFFAVLRKTRFDWIMAVTALLGMLFWFWIEIAVLLELHWLHAMWGLPVVVGALAALPLVPSTYKQKALLSCGILSSVLYFAINIIVPLQWEGYSLASRVPSELSAIGAPTRKLWAILATPYTFLILAFGWGVLKAAGENHWLRIAGKLLLAYGALGFLWPFAPMHLRETLAAGGGTFSDTLHKILAAVTNLIYLLALGFSAAALGKRFRVYSIVTLALVLVFGVLTFKEVSGVAKNEPTPLIGVWERIDIGLFLIWVVVLAIVLLQEQRNKKTYEQPSNETRSVKQDKSKTPKFV